MANLPVPTLACDVVLEQLTDIKVAIAALNALYAAFVDNGLFSSGPPLEYDISLIFVLVPCDDTWENIIDELSEGLEKFFLWQQFATVIVKLDSSGEPTRGTHTWEL